MSGKISDKWKNLGRRLQFDEAQITEHDKNNDKISEKAYKLLIAWKRRDASDATYRVLHEALSDVERRDLAQEFCCQRKRYFTILFAFVCIIEQLQPDIEYLKESLAFNSFQWYIPLDALTWNCIGFNVSSTFISCHVGGLSLNLRINSFTRVYRKLDE